MENAVVTVKLVKYLKVNKQAFYARSSSDVTKTFFKTKTKTLGVKTKTKSKTLSKLGISC